MIKIILAFMAIGVVVIPSCKNATEKKEAGLQETTEVATIPGSSHQEEAIPVELNNGQKWEANMETTREIAIMQGLLGEFPSSPTVEDYRGLHKKLITGFQSILQKCTMKGDAHNQLHNYLMPYKKMIDTFGTGSLEECNKIFPEMQGYLMKYSQYFM
jgi:hypothetical protein